MKRTTALLIFAPFILAALTFAGWNTFTGKGRGPAIQRQLEADVASGATEFDFAADQSFQWDRMFVFDPYTSQESVENSLGFAWWGYHLTSIESSEGVCLVVFVKNGEVVGWFEQSRKIELAWLSSDQGYSRQEAVFTIEREKDLAFLKPKKPPPTLHRT